MNIYGKDSLLKIETELKNNRTILKDSFFSAPLKIAKPFYDDRLNIMKLCMLNVSAGILAGDSYNIEIDVRKNSSLQVYTQSYSKVFQMKEGFAEQKLTISVEDGACFMYMPHPIIPYAKSNYMTTNIIKLKDTSSLFFRDIISCGRYKRDEIFKFNKFKSNTKVYISKKLIFADNTVLEPEIQKLNAVGFYEGYTHQANVLIYNKRVNEQLKNKIVSFIDSYQNIECGVTITYSNFIVIRMLGKSSERLKLVTDDLAEYMINIESVNVGDIKY